MIDHWKKMEGKKIEGNLNILAMVWSFPLLPPQKFLRGYLTIKRQAQNIQDEKVQIFLRYVNTIWIKIASVVSVYNLKFRTNNFIESNNRYLKDKLGIHPNLWVFFGMIIMLNIKNILSIYASNFIYQNIFEIDNMNLLLKDHEMDMERLRTGVNYAREARKSTKERNNYIALQQAKLANGS